MRLRKALIALVVLLSVCGCNLSKTTGCDGDESDCEPDRTYLYMAQNADGETDAARGNIVLRFTEVDEKDIVSRIVGTWEIEKLDGAGEIGPQSGEGELRGVVREDGSVRIDLNPDIADQTVLLTGNFATSDRRVLGGEWTYQTLGGSTSGEFEASQ